MDLAQIWAALGAALVVLSAYWIGYQVGSGRRREDHEELVQLRAQVRKLRDDLNEERDERLRLERRLGQELDRQPHHGLHLTRPRLVE